MRWWSVVLLVGCAETMPDLTLDSDSDPDSDSSVDTEVMVDPPELTFVAVDNGRDQFLYVDQAAGTSWSTPLPSGARDIAVLGDSAVLVSTSAGFARVSLVEREVSWEIDDFDGVQSARSLSDGTLLLAAQAGSDVALITLDGNGEELGRRTLTGYGELRLVRVLDGGNVLLTTGEPWRAVEIDPNGDEVWSVALPGKGYLAQRDVDGLTWASTGDDRRVIAYDAAGEASGELGGAEASDGLDWFSGFHRWPTGHTIVANWLGHGAWGTGPHLVAFDPQGEVVWTWEDHDAAMQITHVEVLSARW